MHLFSLFSHIFAVPEKRVLLSVDETAVFCFVLLLSISNKKSSKNQIEISMCDYLLIHEFKN